MWQRNCPECNDVIEYKNRQSVWLGNKHNAKCRPCYSKIISSTLIDKHNSGELKVTPRRSAIPKSEKKYYKLCSDCGIRQYYTTEKNRNEGKRLNTVCNSCSNFKYNKTWNDVITEDSIKQMRAAKAGFSSWGEYEEKYPIKKQYQKEVWRLTYKQPIEDLPGWEKRGLCGVEGAWQLDHITSVNEGYLTDTPPSDIADISNLRMIPWEENRNKGA
jgi:hypothetical protein